MNENPYNSPGTVGSMSQKSKRNLKYIAHGIYLQLFIGVGCLCAANAPVDLSGFNGPMVCGCLLIGLGLNSLIYIQRYKKSSASAEA